MKKEKVDLFELAAEARRALSEDAFDRFQDVCMQVASAVERTGGEEFWFQPKEERDKILSITMGEFVKKYGAGKEKNMNLSTLSREKVEEVIFCKLTNFQNIGGAKAEKIWNIFKNQGINIPSV